MNTNNNSLPANRYNDISPPEFGGRAEGHPNYPAASALEHCSFNELEPEPITQDDLVRYADLHESMLQYSRLRKRLLRSLDNGADVERGPHWISIDVSEKRIFSAHKLERVLGADRVAELKSQIEPTIHRSLRVTSWGG